MTKIPPQRKRRRFVRDVEIHGHHRDCDCSLEAMDRNERHVCTCFALDEDDRISEGERAYDAWKEGDFLDKEATDEQEA